MTRISKSFSSLSVSLLSAALLLAATLAGCGPAEIGKPDLPTSVAPGWHLDSFVSIPKPADIPDNPVCWKGNYSASPSTAEVLVCGYKSGGSFNAAQRVIAGAQGVKFEAGNYFVLVKWNNAPKASVTALVRAIQQQLTPK